MVQEQDKSKWVEPELTDNQKKIAAFIKENEGITGSELSDKVGIAQSSINHNIEKLEDLDIVYNKAFEHRKTSYYIGSNAQVQSNISFERFVTRNMKIHLFEISSLIPAFAIFPDTTILAVMIGFTIGFLPTFSSSISQVLDEGLFETKVKVRQ